ncbi:MAG: carbohydrate-binding protein, partial [Actinomycetia bacterium]|nr:carbohydrate-binding protein [Actinomycetes bacterium]
EFDWGGQDRLGFGAFNDTYPGWVNDIRTLDSVDLEATTDIGGGSHVTSTETGEWYEYTIDVMTAGTYDLVLRVASSTAGGTVKISIDGTDETGFVTVPWDAAKTWQDLIIEDVQLDAGVQVMQVEVGGDGWDLNKITVRPDTCTLIASKAGWSIEYVDSEQTLPAEDGVAANTIDGDPATLWVTQYDPSADPLPHEIWIDLGTDQDLCGFRYTPRQAGNTNAIIEDYELYVKAGSAPSQSPTVEGEWTLVSNGTLHTSASAPGAPAAAVTLELTPVTARYVRLKATSEIGGNPWSQANELDLFAVATTTGPTLEVVPPAEVALLRVNESGGDVVLTWDDVTTDLTGSPESAVTYHVYSDPSPDTGVTTVLAVAPAATYSHAGAFDD